MAALTEATVLIFGIFVILMLVPYHSSAQGSSGSKKSFIIKIVDFKDFKKLLRTKTNLLIICAHSEKATAKVIKLFEDVAEEMKGKATLGYINCGDDKKFCKKLKFSPTEFDLKHYKDGEFNKDYDRKLTFKSMVNFLQDPTGDLPWEEDPTAIDIVHVSSEDSFQKLLKKEKNPILVMFYAPWCGYCKQLKPHFAEAATELKDQVLLLPILVDPALNGYQGIPWKVKAADMMLTTSHIKCRLVYKHMSLASYATGAFAGVDVDKPPMVSLRLQYNITGFPTLYYFEKGRVKYKYGGENNKAGIVSWLQNPQAPKEKEKEPEWADEESEVIHLTDDTYDAVIKQNPSVLVMFYAPWCGHCKKMKPGYTEAARILKEQNVVGVLAAVDATKEKRIAQEHAVKGFPTVKYFKNGEFAFEVNERDMEKIVEFMKDPQEPPPPPAPEPKWEEVESEVVHLTDDSFKPFLKKKKHCLIMFYAPWCGHCKKAKPEFMAAAEKFKSDPKVAFAAVDCTIQTGTCKSNDVTGYPTFKYFNYGKNSQKYMGGREENDFIAFMNDPLNPAPSHNQPPPVESMEDQWKAYPGFQSVAFLNSDTFNQTVTESVQVLVMFYAPWCGHCQKMKPDFAEAAQIVKDNYVGLLAAVDATQERDLAEKFNVKGYPTLMFFTGDQVTEYASGRSRDELVGFMFRALYGDEGDDMASKSLTKQNDTSVIPFLQSRSIKALSSANFSQVLSKKDSAVLVMFYDPDCIYCQSAKPHFLKAAKTTDSKNRIFATVDCTKEEQLCSLEHVQDFPTFKLFVGGKFLARYNQPPNFNNLRNFVENAPLTTNVDDSRYRSQQSVDVKFVPGGQKPKQEL